MRSGSHPAVYPGSPLRRIMSFMTMMAIEVLDERKDLGYGTRVPWSRCVEMAGTDAAWISDLQNGLQNVLQNVR